MKVKYAWIRRLQTARNVANRLTAAVLQLYRSQGTSLALHRVVIVAEPGMCTYEYTSHVAAASVLRCVGGYIFASIVTFCGPWEPHTP
jgi:hypothetical protein